MRPLLAMLACFAGLLLAWLWLLDRGTPPAPAARVQTVALPTLELEPNEAEPVDPEPVAAAAPLLSHSSEGAAMENEEDVALVEEAAEAPTPFDAARSGTLVRRMLSLRQAVGEHP